MKTLTSIASSARILSWVVLAAFVLMMSGNIYNLRELSQNTAVHRNGGQSIHPCLDFHKHSYPLFTGATFFVVLQGVCNIIDALLEIDFNTRRNEIVFIFTVLHKRLEDFQPFLFVIWKIKKTPAVIAGVRKGWVI
jgi:hypothetical protein